MVSACAVCKVFGQIANVYYAPKLHIKQIKINVHNVYSIAIIAKVTVLAYNVALVLHPITKNVHRYVVMGKNSSCHVMMGI